MSYNNGNQAVVSLVTGTDMTVSFDARGLVTGQARRNSYTGPSRAEAAPSRSAPWPAPASYARARPA